MAETILKTKIALLYKTYAQWVEIQNEYVPLAGEVCLCAAPTGSGVSLTEPTVLIKVGDGTKTFAQLDWVSAKAQDVHSWAKKASLDWDDLDASFRADLIALINEQAPKKTMSGTNGTARIFNEADGGGAKFEHNDGSESFVGVNDGGKDGLMAQIYADKLVDGKWQGAKLDVTNGAIYYTVGNKSFSERAISDNELVVKKDIKDLEGGMHFIGAIVPEAGESLEQTIARLYATKGKSYADRKPGDIVIIKTPGDDREYICDADKQWVELGSQGLYATKAELAAEEEAREDADSTLQANIDAEATTRASEDAKKVDKEIASAEGKALIFNEADGGGAKFEHVSGINSFVGVNNGGEDEEGLAAQIYAVDATESGHNLGAKLDVTAGGMYYTRGAASGSRPSSRDVPANELAVKRDITEASTTLDNKITAETNRATAAEQALDTNKLNVLPNVDDPTDPGYGWPYHIPYDVAVTPGADKIDLTLKTLTLDNKVTKMSFNKSLPGASQSAAGLMSSTDKAKLDHFYAKDLTQETGDVLILNCNM